MRRTAKLLVALYLLSSFRAVANPPINYDFMLKRCFTIVALALPLNEAMLNQGENRVAEVIAEHSFVPDAAVRIMEDSSQSLRMAPLHRRITTENISTVVNYAWNQNNPAILGAKGILVEVIPGKYEVVFWSQGQGTDGNNIHHKDAAASIIDHHAAMLEDFAFQKDSKNLLGESEELRKLATTLHIDRGQRSYPDFVLQRFQGFQVSGVKNAQGVIELTRIDIDSSITTTQASRKLTLSAQKVNSWYDAITAHVDPALLARNLTYGYKANLNITDRSNLKAPNNKIPLAIN